LPFKVIVQPPTLRQHFGTTWPDHFSKADYDPAWQKKNDLLLKIKNKNENEAIIDIGLLLSRWISHVTSALISMPPRLAARPIFCEK